MVPLSFTEDCFSDSKPAKGIPKTDPRNLRKSAVSFSFLAKSLRTKGQELLIKTDLAGIRW
jgi:hypothetical protein